MKLTDILGKDRITAYEAGQVIESVGQVLQKFEHTMLTESDYIKSGTQTLLDQAKELRIEVLKQYQTIDDLAEKAEKLGNEQYDRVKKAHDRMMHRVAALPEIKPPATWGMKEVLELAGRCSHFTDDQWARVIDLAKALAPKQ